MAPCVEVDAEPPFRDVALGPHRKSGYGSVAAARDDPFDGFGGGVGHLCELFLGNAVFEAEGRLGAVDVALYLVADVGDGAAYSTDNVDSALRNIAARLCNHVDGPCGDADWAEILVEYVHVLRPAFPALLLRIIAGHLGHLLLCELGFARKVGREPRRGDEIRGAFGAADGRILARPGAEARVRPITV